MVLADNGSTDGAPERAAERPGVELLRTGGNLGYGRAANLGVPRAPGDWVVVANPDLTLGAGRAGHPAGGGRAVAGAGVLGPAILSAGRHALPVGPGAALARPRHRARAARLVVAVEPVDGGVPAGARRADRGQAGWLSGSCMLLRREAFDAVGGFDPAYFMYFEDLDLCERICRAGWQIVYVPAAVVIHEGGASTSRDPRAMADAHHASAWRYLSRRYAGARWAPVRLALRAGLAAPGRAGPPGARGGRRRPARAGRRARSRTR